VLERKAATLLAEFSQTVAGKDRAKISEALQRNLTDNATVHLTGRFISLLHIENPKIVEQEMDKAAFIAFIDNILFTMTDYAYEPELITFELSDDRKKASARFTSREWADGANHYAGVSVGMRFSSHSDCTGQVAIDGDAMRLERVNCKLDFSAVPRPEEAHKLGNSEVLQQWLH